MLKGINRMLTKRGRAVKGSTTTRMPGFPWFLGFGLVWGVEFDLFSTNTLFSVVGFQRVQNDPFNVLTVMAIIAACLVIVLLSRKGILKPHSIPRHLPTALVIGSLLVIMLFPTMTLPQSNLLLGSAGVANGIGFGLLTVAWQETFVRDEPFVSTKRVALAFLFGSILCTLLQLLPFMASATLAIASMIGSDLALGRVRENAAIPLIERPKATRKVFSLIAASLLFTCVLEALYTASTQVSFSGPHGFADSNLAFNIAIVVASAVFFLTVFRRNSSQPAPLYGDVIFLIVGGALLLLPFMGTDYGIILGALVVASAHVVFEALVIMSINATRALRANAYIVLGTVEACIRTTSLLGVLVGTVLFRNDMGFMQLMLFSFAGIYLLGLVLAITLRRLQTEKATVTAAPTVESLALAKLSPEQRAELARIAEDILRERCIKLGRQDGLTQRETDVLCCLARGNSIAGIAEELGISANTVKTHAKMVYVKLDVHNRQELSRLIQSDADTA